MRNLFAVMLLAAAALPMAGAGPTRADPYPWCADYGLSNGGGTNCYFSTIQQCQAAVSGIGGYCRANGLYDGRPVTTPDGAAPRDRRRGSR